MNRSYYLINLKICSQSLILITKKVEDQDLMENLAHLQYPGSLDEKRISKEALKRRVAGERHDRTRYEFGKEGT